MFVLHDGAVTESEDITRSVGAIAVNDIFSYYYWLTFTI